MNRGFTNVFRGHPRATKRSGVAQATRPNPQVETNGDDNNLAASDQSNVAQSNRPIPTVETQDDDDEIIVLERKPSTWQKHEKVKQETVTVKQEQLAVEVRISPSRQTPSTLIPISCLWQFETNMPGRTFTPLAESVRK